MKIFRAAGCAVFTEIKKRNQRERSIRTQKRKGIISSVTSLVVAVVAFVIYATTKSDKVPDGAIGQADAMTNIQVEGTFGFDASQVILVVGIIAVTFAVIQIIRTVRNNRR